MTPEGKVKKQIKDILDPLKPKVWYHMAVTNGMGMPTLDFTGCAHGNYFAIEAKALGEKPTPRQVITIADMRLAGARVFVIDGDTTDLEVWLSHSASGIRI